MHPSVSARGGAASRVAAAVSPGVSIESLESRLVLSVVAPTGLEATLVAPRAVVVEWTDVTGETGYVVERRVDGTTEPWARVGETGADVTRFTQDGLAAGKTYLYRVRAREGEAASEPSNVDFVTVPGEATVPQAPRLEAEYFRSGDANYARLRWTNVADETGYKLERRVDGSDASYSVVMSFDADAAAYNDGPLDAGKTYLYRVRALNAHGQSAASNTVAVVVPGVGRPAAPRELVAELVQGQFVRLRWADVEGERGYRIERRLDGSGSGEWVQVGSTAENVVTVADERIERGRTYIYRVRAYNEAGLSGYSNPAAVSVPAGEPGLAAPRELEAELDDARRVKLRWNDVAGEKGYKIERRVDGTAEWVQVGTTGANVTRFEDERVEPGKTYVYRVRAFNDAGNSSYSNTDAVRVPGEQQAPAAPRLEADRVAPRAVRLAWTNVANETGYRIERRVDGSPEGWKQVRSVGANVTTMTQDGLEPGKTYLYRVRAFNAAGASAYSNVAAVRTAGEPVSRPAAPRELRAAAVSPTRVDLRWVGVEGETGYRIERRLDGTDAWEKVTFTAADVTSFSDARVLAGKTYVYRVRAQGTTEASAWSNTAAVKTPEAIVLGAVADLFSSKRIAPLAL